MTEATQTPPLKVPDVRGLSVPEAAVAWAEAGWYVFPCEATNHDNTKGSFAKRPHSMLRDEAAERGEGGWKLASNDPEKVRAWWGKDPTALIGVPPGMSGGVVLDADGQTGVRKLFDVAEDFDLFSTPTTRTPGKGGGMHVWFDRRAQDGVVGNGGLEGVPGEARGDRGYVIVPPSTLPDGGQYSFTAPGGGDEEEVGHTCDTLQHLPAWASALLPWEKEGSLAPSIADVTKGDEQAWLMSAGAPWSDDEAKLLIREGIEEITNAPKGDVDRGRHPTATRVIASLLSKAQRKEVSINLMEALSAVRDAFIAVKPEGVGDFDRFVSDAVARRVAEDRAKLSSMLSIEDLDIPRELPPEWDAPSVSQLEGTGKPFPTEILPDVMRRIVTEVAKDAQVSEVLPALAALGAASAATAGGFEMRPAHTWREGTALYLIGVAPPSERKSATLRPFVSSVARAAKRWEEATALERARWEAEGESLKVREREAKKVAGTPEGQKELAAIRLSMEAHVLDGIRLTKPNGIIHSDPTQEALIVSMSEQLGVGFVASAEGAFVANLAGKYSSNPDERTELSNMNSAWAREGIRSLRISRGDARVDTPHLTVLTLVQPYVAELLANPSFEQSGFLSRVLYVHPRSMVTARRTKLRGHSPYYEIAREKWDARIEALFRRGWGQIEDPIVLTLETDGIAEYERFWQECERRAKDGWWGKAHGQVLRIATLMQLVEEPAATQVSASWLRAAITIVEFFGEERAVMRRAVVEGDAGGVVHTESVKRLLRHMAQRWDQIAAADHVVRVRDASRWLRVPAQEAVMLMEELIEQRWLREAEDLRGNAYRVRGDLPEQLRGLEKGEWKGQPLLIPTQEPTQELHQEVAQSVTQVSQAPQSVTKVSNDSAKCHEANEPGSSKEKSQSVEVSRGVIGKSSDRGIFTTSSSSYISEATPVDSDELERETSMETSPETSTETSTGGESGVSIEVDSSQQIEQTDSSHVEDAVTLRHFANPASADSAFSVSQEVSESVTPIRHFGADGASRIVESLDEAVDGMLTEADVLEMLAPMVDAVIDAPMPEPEQEEDAAHHTSSEAGHTSVPVSPSSRKTKIIASPEEQAALDRIAKYKSTERPSLDDYDEERDGPMFADMKPEVAEQCPECGANLMNGSFCMAHGKVQ